MVVQLRGSANMERWAADESLDPAFRLQAQFWAKNQDLVQLLCDGVHAQIAAGERSLDDRSNEISYILARFGWLVKKAREL